MLPPNTRAAIGRNAKHSPPPSRDSRHAHLVTPEGQPRYWALLWANVLRSGLQEGTRAHELAAVELFYRAVATQTGKECLDRLLATPDLDGLESALGVFLASLRNDSAITGIDRQETWRVVLRFVRDVVMRHGVVAEDALARIESRLRRLDRLYSQVSPAPPKPPAPIRALPALVVEDLYALFNPESPRNPFRTERLRWRNYLIFLALLHLGLRRGEALILPANAVKEEFDPATGAQNYWINVIEAPRDEPDPRAARPAIKTQTARRHLPVSEQLVALFDIYSRNYRGRCAHGFLFSSQKQQPLAAQTLGDIFQTVSQHLSAPARQALTNRRKDGVRAHDLRHSAAVVRLAKYLAHGDEMDKAIEKLRVFFGWTRTSQMPRHYARAYFETGLAEIWHETFDSYVEALRDLTGAPE